MNRTRLDALISATLTFFGVLLIVAFAIGVSSRDALKGADAFVLRWTVISLMVAFSALVAWVRWKFFLLPPLSSGRRAVVAPAQLAEPRQPADLSSRAAGRLNPPRTRLPGPKSSNAPVRAASEPSPDIVAASRQAIVFRQHFPPPHRDSALSFFGGSPVAPRGFRWPRPAASGPQSKPLSFLMQIDCSEVPAPARLGLLPNRGVVYFFLDLTWGQQDAFRVLYEDGDATDWRTVEPPADLGQAFGDQATFVWRWTQSADDCPRLLPKWSFQPIALEIPPDAYDPRERETPDAPFLWPGEKLLAEALRRAQGEDVPSTWFSIGDLIDEQSRLRRPFANYPPDWRAVQICSGLLLHKTRNGLPSTYALRASSESERTALVRRIRDEAKGWFDRAASHAPFAAVPPRESDEFWSWLADKPWLVRFAITDALTMSVEASLNDSPEAAARIPSDVARRVHGRHALAVHSEKGLFARTPDRMLAPPVDVQGYQWDRAKTHLLLLELSSNDGLGHHFGEGVYQFWITPADLRARRFDKVELTADAY
jgi:Domain of unknown function (DUF1963)